MDLTNPDPKASKDLTVLDLFRKFVIMEGSAPQILVDALDDLEHHYFTLISAGVPTSVPSSAGRPPGPTAS
ncbi:MULTISPECIES: hypothetical protein [Bradyrhizobium]|uniref:hypothetical protein n=1 Tax=Bradyrhizobium TaxID=374 RepID=UPI0004B4B51C|nr:MULTISPECIES: hypothetical protein [Bradyrhizobium]MBR1034676.1 hypothetical protein [Bradyrhizobium liaoningense]MCP1774881.1 hypothetical protein [Bradyrhizobium japonicum]MCP1962118.1 hypothetical protein [Bradyrhizobium japonicum]MDI2077993.1 hypothetical protein [Bradyrhizobium sp. Mp27]